MSLTTVCSNDIKAMNARYLFVIESLDDKAKARLTKKAVKIYPVLLESLKELSNHSEIYLSYLLTRNFKSYNLVHILDNPKVGRLNLNVLKLFLSVWEDYYYMDTKTLFGSKDSLDTPYRYLYYLLKGSHRCHCGKLNALRNLIYSEDAFKCSCSCVISLAEGSPEFLLPYGISNKIQRKHSFRSRKAIIL